MNRIEELFQRIPVPIRELLVPACVCVFALILLGGPLSLRTAAYDGKTNFYADDLTMQTLISDKNAVSGTVKQPSFPAVQALVSGKNACDSIDVAENGELTLDGRRTHVWPGTGTTKQWFAGLTVGRDTIVADDGQFRVYRDRKLVAQTECAPKSDWHSIYDHIITVGDNGVVYLYDYRGVRTWDGITGTFKTLAEKAMCCTSFFDDTGWIFVYEDENDTLDTRQDNTVHVLNSKKGIDRVLAENALVLGGFNGFIRIRFFIAADENHPTREYGAIDWWKWEYDHYTDLHKFAITGETEWWDEYADRDVQEWIDEGYWYDPIPHKFWRSNGSGVFHSAI